MNSIDPTHILQPGQILEIRWRSHRNEPGSRVYEILKKLKLTIDNNGNPYASVFVTYVNEEGISVFINRGYTYGGEIEAFLPKKDVSWQSYFQPLDSFNTAYAGSKHFKKIFPIDFL